MGLELFKVKRMRRVGLVLDLDLLTTIIQQLHQLAAFNPSTFVYCLFSPKDLVSLAFGLKLF